MCLGIDLDVHLLFPKLTTRRGKGCSAKLGKNLSECNSIPTLIVVCYDIGARVWWVCHLGDWFRHDSPGTFVLLTGAFLRERAMYVTNTGWQDPLEGVYSGPPRISNASAAFVLKSPPYLSFSFSNDNLTTANAISQRRFPGINFPGIQSVI